MPCSPVFAMDTNPNSSSCALMQQGNGQWFSETNSIMGTEITVELWHKQPVVACAAIRAVMVEMSRIDALMSPFIVDSTLSKLNENGASGPVVVGEELFGAFCQ